MKKILEKDKSKAVKKETEVKVNKEIAPVEVDLIKFNKLSAEDQFKFLEKTLNDIYKDALKIRKKHIMKCISLTCEVKDAANYLPYSLRVEKSETKLTFKFVKRHSTPVIIIFAGLFFLATLGATYAGVTYLVLSQLNIDIDGDGVADINIDTNADRVADINVITTNQTRVPNINVDYKANRKSTFNIDSNGDTVADTNLINQPVNGFCYTLVEETKIPIVNCDTNGDGWPDINMDIYGNGYLILDRDTNWDNTPDLNIDRNGDKVCDLMCDTDDDEKCDLYCVNPENLNVASYNGSTAVVGDPTQNINSATLLIVFSAENEVVIDDVFPDDQPGYERLPEIPKLAFSVENRSPISVIYKLKWIVFENSFTTQNFQYMLDNVSDNGGEEFDWTAAPHNTPYIFTDSITILPGVTQHYEMSFRLRGINAEQNDDQGKTFHGKVEAEIIEATP